MYNLICSISAERILYKKFINLICVTQNPELAYLFIHLFIYFF